MPLLPPVTTTRAPASRHSGTPLGRCAWLVLDAADCAAIFSYCKSSAAYPASGAATTHDAAVDSAHERAKTQTGGTAAVEVAAVAVSRALPSSSDAGAGRENMGQELGSVTAAPSDCSLTHCSLASTCAC